MPKFEVVISKIDWGSAVIEAETLEEAQKYAEDNLEEIDYEIYTEGNIELSDVVVLKD